jgi:hypothetical protein
MRTISRVLAMIVAAISLGGCPALNGLDDSLFGTWRQTTFIEGERVDMDIEFQADGTFYRSIFVGNEMASTEVGTWQVNLNQDPLQIDLHTTDGSFLGDPIPPYTILAIYRLWDDTLTPQPIDYLDMAWDTETGIRPPSFVSVEGIYMFDRLPG